MELDRHGLEVLDRGTCLRLLTQQSVGRIAVTVSALPAIFPVHFTLMDEDIVFRTASGSKLTAAVQRAVVAFEVDDVDPTYHSGWSVLVIGPASEITHQHELDRAQRLPLLPWAPGSPGHHIRIRSEIVSGRRLGTGTGEAAATAGAAAAPGAPDS